MQERDEDEYARDDFSLCQSLACTCEDDDIHGGLEYLRTDQALQMPRDYAPQNKVCRRFRVHWHQQLQPTSRASYIRSIKESLSSSSHF